MVKKTTDPIDLSKHPDTEMPMNQETKNPVDNDTFSFSDEQLKQFFAPYEENQPDLFATSSLAQNDDEGLLTQFTSTFGLQDAVAGIAFLKSPAGHDVMRMVREELTEEAEKEENEEFLASEESKAHHRRLAFLLLALMSEGEAAADALNEAINAQNEAILHAHEELQHEAAARAFEMAEQDAYYRPQLESYEHAVKDIDQKLSQKNLEDKQADKNISDLEKEGKALKAEDETLQNNLTEMDTFEESTNASPDQSKQIDQRIDSLESNLQTQDESIKGLVESGDDVAAKKAINNRQGTQLQLEGLREKQDVVQGRKHFWTDKGDKVDSHKDAHIALDSKKQIVKEGGKCYLIPAGESLDSIKNSANGQEKLANSHNEFKKALTDHGTVHKKTQRASDEKQANHAQRFTEAHAHKATVQRDMQLLQSDKTKIQTAQNQLKLKQQRTIQRLEQPSQSRLAPQPNSPTPLRNTATPGQQSRQSTTANPSATATPTRGERQQRPNAATLREALQNPAGRRAFIKDMLTNPRNRTGKQMTPAEMQNMLRNSRTATAGTARQKTPAGQAASHKRTEHSKAAEHGKSAEQPQQDTTPTPFSNTPRPK